MSGGQRRQRLEVDARADGDAHNNGQPSLPKRTRRFPHQKGQWPTFACCPVPSRVRFVALTSALTASATAWIEAHTPLAPLQPCPHPLHVSLCRTFPLRQAHLGRFLGAITPCLQGKARVRVKWNAWRWFVSDDGSTSFLALVPRPRDLAALCTLIHAVNPIVRRYGGVAYYEPAIPHVSVAWTQGNVLAHMSAGDAPDASGDSDDSSSDSDSETSSNTSSGHESESQESDAVQAEGEQLRAMSFGVTGSLLPPGVRCGSSLGECQVHTGSTVTSFPWVQ